jgi:hypothetical protein
MIWRYQVPNIAMAMETYYTKGNGIIHGIIIIQITWKYQRCRIYTDTIIVQHKHNKLSLKTVALHIVLSRQLIVCGSDICGQTSQDSIKSSGGL